MPVLDQTYPVQQYKNLNGETIFSLDPQGNLTLLGTISAGTPGQTFWVDAASGDDTNSGSGPTSALATINAALALCTANAGNTIKVMPGSYDENILVEIDGVTLIGAVNGGYERPDIVPTTGVPLTVIAQGFACAHMRFAPTADDDVFHEGNGFIYQDCVFDGDGTANKGFRLIPNAVDDSFTASEGIISDCLFRGNGVGLIFDTAVAAVGVGSTDNKIIGNVFQANTLDIATADSGTASTYSVKLVLIQANQFVDKNKATYIDFTTANGGAASDQTGAVNGNTFASDTMTTTKIKAVGTGFTFSGNYDTVGIFDGSGLD